MMPHRVDDPYQVDFVLVAGRGKEEDLYRRSIDCLICSPSRRDEHRGHNAAETDREPDP